MSLQDWELATGQDCLESLSCIKFNTSHMFPGGCSKGGRWGMELCGTSAAVLLPQKGDRGKAGGLCYHV